MSSEEVELLSDSKYRQFIAAVEKALRSFESTSEWADLISALGKLNKVSNRTISRTALKFFKVRGFFGRRFPNIEIAPIFTLFTPDAIAKTAQYMVFNCIFR